MTLAYWCIFVLMFVPIICAGYGKVKGGFTRADNSDSRAFFDKVEGISARANASQLNSFEVFPVFAAAVIIAHITGGAAQSTIDILSVLFVISRVVYCVCYIADWARVRSLIWTAGFICVLALFIAAV